MKILFWTSQTIQEENHLLSIGFKSFTQPSEKRDSLLVLGRYVYTRSQIRHKCETVLTEIVLISATFKVFGQTLLLISLLVERSLLDSSNP